jgi:hypothetical protein
VLRIALGGVAVYPTLPGEKQTMEMRECGKGSIKGDVKTKILLSILKEDLVF